jgi:hypothetical protein
MVKTIIKIAIALLLVNGVVRCGLAYWNFYRFEDALQQLAQFAERRSDKQLCDEANEAALSYAIPLGPGGLTIFRGNFAPYSCDGTPSAIAPGGAQPGTQIRIEGVYTERIAILPGYLYPWEFRPAVKAWLRL